jgi:hypothetical protein
VYIKHIRTLEYKRPNLRIHRVEEGSEIQTKDIGNLFNGIIVENFSTLFNDINIHVQEVC